MKQYIGIIAAVIAFIIGGVTLTGRINDKTEELARTQDYARIQRDYYERVGWIRSNPDEKAYKDEVQSFFRWYFKEINAHQSRFGGSKNFDDYLAELNERSAKGGDPQLAEKKARYDYARAVFDQFKSASYAPVFSGSDKGMRFDVLQTSKAGSGEDAKIRLPVVVWGAQRDLRDEDKPIRMNTSAAFRQTWKIYDAKGKLHGEMNVDGDPSMKIDWPERYIREFPAQMVLGYFEVGLLPPQASKLEIQFSVNSRAPSGGDAGGQFTWKLDVPPEWKLPEGSAWKGAEEEARAAEEATAG